MELYQNAYIEKMEEQRDVMNYKAWLYGQYNLAAIGAAMSKKVRYPQKPFVFQEKDNGLSAEERFMLWVDEFNRRFEGAPDC